MSKNIVMQELTASGYEELYPKTSASEVNFSDTTINQFLGGGEGAESALAYLSNFGKYWWRKSEDVSVYQIKLTFVQSNKVLKNIEADGSLTFNTFDLAINKETGEFIKSNIKSHTASHSSSSQNQFSIDGVSYSYKNAQNENIVTQIPCPTYYEIDGTIYYEPTGFCFTLIGTYEEGGFMAKSQSSVDKETVTINQDVYVYSDSSSTYPDKGNTQDGFSYWYIGSLLDALPEMGKVEYSSYVGTGESVSTLPLTFSRRPLFVAVTPSAFAQSTYNAGIIWTGGTKAYMYWKYSSMAGDIFDVLIPSDSYGITINNTTAAPRLNVKDVTYYVFAITQ